MKLSVIFKEKPQRWGFRGDPYFWDHLKELAENMDIITPDELKKWIKEEYLSVSGKELTDKYEDFAVVEQFAHGGMSSGGDIAVLSAAAPLAVADAAGGKLRVLYVVYSQVHTHTADYYRH